MIGQGLGINQQATQMGDQLGDSMMNNMMHTQMRQMMMQQMQGLMAELTKLSEGLAKLFKAIGDAVKGLCG
jgi:hypothetical protein